MNTEEIRKLVNLLVKAWYLRTLPVIDLDNGGEKIRAITQKEWEDSVKEDLNKLISKLLITNTE